MTGKDATGGGLFPAAVHAVTGGGHRRRAEIVAGAVLGTLSLMVVVGWRSAPGESGEAVGNQTLAPTPPHGDGALTYTAVTASGSSDAVTASILAFMIAGAALIGLFFYSPRPDADAPAFVRAALAQTQRRLRRSGAAFATTCLRGAEALAHEAYSSMAPGAVLETVIRNSTLLLVFFNRSTSRSIA
ncbi:hypothetical protein LTV02_25400 [Nocardia yamanashiensis]|uniref:hypothetical protein n=1 Tax=Nocardia yamanashiensis TaxID=209247 RepID=UPI001E597A82|nr:hypothetical protein [Nocardia yamanashiensis]UGT39397.1 hypothetical protein LTV02_25400 [Nocardia yamanashiensis]